ncbi:pre-mRNA processing factor 3-domain-containing protein [Lentinula aciculospora]|uniref:Pre-mRNA processing factor 3-domain-containing protein n=1 Tax=Lentinula aciculospora TaxID=153920 RepID=A0A9W8ZXW0_9AGAR|nr:pre-mRNA processing factor 3-domain-containing protein [Lentinula aciculospora]
MNDRKRPLDGSSDGGNTKKFKSDSSAALIAQKRAEIAAKMAAMRNTVLSGADVTLPGATASGASIPPGANGNGQIAAPTPKPAIALPKKPISSSTTPDASDLARRVAEAKRKVAEYQSKLAVKDNPYMTLPQTGKNKNRAPEPSQQGSGLKMTAHPLLLDQTPVAPQSKKDRYKPMQPKFASIKANARNIPTPPPLTPVPSVTPTSNPYATTTKDAEGAPKDRTSRTFRFNPKGKYIALGNQMRQDLQLEALKNRIAESARKAGLDGDMGIERNIKRLAPPTAEWWDTPLLPTQSYSDIQNYGIGGLHIENSESPITIYVQHPIKIPPPGEKNKVGLKPMMLTKKEQKKMRKLRRASELQDKRDRIRMGLLPPDPPKVRLANLMKVLTSDAIQDPTRVEAKVRREVAMRKHQHEKTNSERKLTDDQRREKVEIKKVDEEKRGIYGAVFKILTLHDPSHQFKVRKNAEQLNLTGVCIFNPHFSLVYVEGAAKFIRNYKRLMLVRIAWTEEARARGEAEVVVQGEGGPSPESEPDTGITTTDPSTTTTVPVPTTNHPSLSSNKCFLIWEGLLKDRSFSSFKAKSCPTDGAAKEVLGEKLRGYWDVARNWKVEEEEEGF